MCDKRSKYLGYMSILNTNIFHQLVVNASASGVIYRCPKQNVLKLSLLKGECFVESQEVSKLSFTY